MGMLLTGSVKPLENKQLKYEAELSPILVFSSSNGFSIHALSFSFKKERDMFL
jgi:hypothetical protein